MRRKCLHSIKKATDVMPLLFDYFQGVFSGRKIEKKDGRTSGHAVPDWTICFWMLLGLINTALPGKWDGEVFR